jgi:hypothetical protein
MREISLKWANLIFLFSLASILLLLSLAVPLSVQAEDKEILIEAYVPAGPRGDSRLLSPDALIVPGTDVTFAASFRVAGIDEPLAYSAYCSAKDLENGLASRGFFQEFENDEYRASFLCNYEKALRPNAYIIASNRQSFFSGSIGVNVALASQDSRSSRSQFDFSFFVYSIMLTGLAVIIYYAVGDLYRGKGGAIIVFNKSKARGKSKA